MLRTTSLFLLLFLGVATPLLAQDCLEDISLTTQAEVDAFDCSHVHGSLRISGIITNVETLGDLQMVASDFYILAAPLTHLDDLARLKTVGGGFYIRNNALQQVDGLSNLERVANTLQLHENVHLDHCCGLYPILASGNTGGVALFYNGDGCGSAEDILAAGPCSVSVEEKPWGLIKQLFD